MVCSFQGTTFQYRIVYSTNNKFSQCWSEVFAPGKKYLGGSHSFFPAEDCIGKVVGLGESISGNEDPE